MNRRSSMHMKKEFKRWSMDIYSLGLFNIWWNGEGCYCCV